MGVDQTGNKKNSEIFSHEGLSYGGLLLKKKTEFDLKVLYKDKWKYYTGKASSEVYKENPFDHKVLKNDLGIFLESDEDLSRIKLKIEYQD